MLNLPEIDALIRAFVTLFVIMDPIGTLPIFISVTLGLSNQNKSVVLTWLIIFSTLILFFFTLFGEPMINSLGISTAAFRIAGGLLLFWTAFEMIYERRNQRRERTIQSSLSSSELRSLAMSPLCIPLLAGPGSITATIILSQEFHEPVARGALLVVILLVLLMTTVLFALAIPLSRFIGETMRIVFTRVLGVILCALAVQIFFDGLHAIMSA